MELSFFLILVPCLYGIVYAFEFIAILARSAGILTQHNVTAYALQQAVYMGTRFSLLFLLPILGYLVDKNISSGTFMLMIHMSFVSATVAGVVCFLLRNVIVGYFSRVISFHSSGAGFVSALMKGLTKKNTVDVPLPKLSKNDFSDPVVRRVLFQSIFVFSIYGTGIFVAFFGALVFNEQRAMISQFSGIVNALGGLLLTFLIEPVISRGIDTKNPQALNLIMALFWGRLIAVAITCHLVMFVLNGVIG